MYYQSAVTAVIEHEIYHGLGVGDAAQAGSIMSKFANITGQPNDTAGTTSVTCCDKKEVKVAKKVRCHCDTD